MTEPPREKPAVPGLPGLLEGSKEGVRELPALIEGLGHQLPVLDAQRAGTEMYGAPRLSLYKLFKPNENALSRVVSDLLDPLGTHGQGPLFLNALLSELGLPRVGARDRGLVRVRREVLTEKRRRTDIVIHTPEVMLGIENKPWAGQSRNQLSDYHCALRKWAGEKRAGERREFALIFLSDQEVPREVERDVRRVPYRPLNNTLSLHSVLSSVVGSIRAARTQAHIEDLIHYISLQFGEDK
ncbi:MAG: PD-(D/E)XK nuclease family protein [Pseudomonadota bacterium]|nr:PD-(D/E)XK nuclease family protein [Pseudomonadota bacterium]